MNVSPDFSALLRANRSDFNARVSNTRQRYPAFNTEIFTQFLQTCVDPLICACDAETRGHLTSAAFDIAINIVGQELYGNQKRGMLIQQLWLECLPTQLQALASDPANVLSTLSNAIVNLSAQPGVRCDQWLSLMSTQDQTLTDADKLIEFGVLAAWRSGAAQFRSSALRIAAQYPELASKVFDLPLDTDMLSFLQQLQHTPWLPNQSIELQPDIGGFMGFGDSFSQPPELQACADGIVVKSAQRYFFLLIDSYGSVLLPSNRKEFEDARTYKPSIKSPSVKNGQLHTARAVVDVNLPPEGLQAVWNDHCVALSSPYSFSILILPCS